MTLEMSYSVMSLNRNPPNLWLPWTGRVKGMVKQSVVHVFPRSEYNQQKINPQVNFSHTQLYEIHNNVFSQLLNLSNEYDFPCFCRKH